MKVSGFVAPVAAALLLAGCATLVSGTSQSVAVATPAAPGATCELSNLEGSWTVVTPAVAQVNRGLDSLQVKCTKPGYDEAWTNLASNWNPVIWANVVNTGVGFGVDAYTSAQYEYPGSVELSMQPAVAMPVRTPDTAPPLPDLFPSK